MAATRGTYQFCSSCYLGRRFQRVPGFLRTGTPALRRGRQGLRLPYGLRIFPDAGNDRYVRLGIEDQPLPMMWSTSCHHDLPFLCLFRSLCYVSVVFAKRCRCRWIAIVSCLAFAFDGLRLCATSERDLREPRKSGASRSVYTTFLYNSYGFVKSYVARYKALSAQIFVSLHHVGTFSTKQHFTAYV